MFQTIVEVPHFEKWAASFPILIPVPVPVGCAYTYSKFHFIEHFFRAYTYTTYTYTYSKEMNHLLLNGRKCANLQGQFFPTCGRYSSCRVLRCRTVRRWRLAAGLWKKCLVPPLVARKVQLWGELIGNIPIHIPVPLWIEMHVYCLHLYPVPLREFRAYTYTAYTYTYTADPAWSTSTILNYRKPVEKTMEKNTPQAASSEL